MARILLILCLAASAGVHAALAPEHGSSFYAATALLGAGAALAAVRPVRVVLMAAAALQLGLLGAYLVVHGAELDTVAAVTKAVELFGLVLAVRLAAEMQVQRPKRVAALVLASVVAVFAAAVTPARGHEHLEGKHPPGASAHRH